MGIGHVYNCSCGYEFRIFYGEGFFSRQYVEDKVKEGSFGEKWKIFREEHPELEILESGVLCVCPSCGFFKEGNDLRFVKAIGDLDIYTKKYELVEGIDVPCEKCGTEMEFFFPKNIDYVYQADPTRRSKVGEIPTLHCPECGKELILRNKEIFWD